MSDERRRQQRAERQRRRRSRRTTSGGALPAGAFDSQLPGVFGWFQRNGRLFYIVGITVMLISLASFFISQNLNRATPPKTTPTPTPTASATASVTPTATGTPPGGKPTWAEAPAMSIDVKKQYEAVIHTEKGDVRVQLLPDKAPIHTNNFVFLARQHYYDGLTFHRVISGFVAQGGDPGGTGTGGPGYSLPDEPNDVPLDAGVISMARSDKASGSQFFITLEPQLQLKDSGFSVFGKVVAGLDVARKLTLRDPQKPNQPPGDLILGIDIREGGG